MAGPILGKSIFDLLFDSIVGMVEKGVGLAQSMGQGLSDGLTSIGDGISNAVPGMGSFLAGGGSDGPSAPAIERAPSQEIQAPSRSEERYSVNMEELGNFSPPSFSAKGPEQNIGIA